MTMPADAIERAAALLAGARLAGSRIERLPADCRPPDEAAAYAVQDALHRQLSAAGCGALAGHKIGCTTPVMQQFLNIANPCAGGVFAPTVQHRHGMFRHADFLHVGVECEIAVRLAKPLPAEGAPYDRNSVAAAVGACMAAIEVVDDRYQDYRSFDTPTLIADDFFNAGCVLGTPVENWRELNLARVVGRMTDQWRRGRERDRRRHSRSPARGARLARRRARRTWPSAQVRRVRPAGQRGPDPMGRGRRPGRGRDRRPRSSELPVHVGPAAATQPNVTAANPSASAARARARSAVATSRMPVVWATARCEASSVRNG